jgi:tRNA(Ile2) C34 agmatinyltransferase TiaS
MTGPDFIEDLFAFLCVNDASDDNRTCPQCGGLLEADPEDGELRCPVCQ